MIEENDFLASLKQIELYLRPSRYSGRVGIHHLAQYGRSLEFAGYQEYRPGDDLKELDWKLFARSDRYYIKQRDTHTFAKTFILLDDSPSMRFSSPSASVSKFRGALLLSFGLGYVLYKQGDAFSLHTLSTEGDPLKPRSSRKAFRHLVDQLQKLEKQGPIGKIQLLFQDAQPKSVDHLFLISDFLVPKKQWNEWLEKVKWVGRDCTCFHVIDSEEENPSYHSDIRHVENSKEFRSLSAEDWNAYKVNFYNHQKELRKFCLEQGIAYKTLRTKDAIEPSIRKVLSSQF